MIPAAGLLILGFALLIKGADWLVDGACSVAGRAGVSRLVIGLTLVAFGTSLPEFFINIASRLGGEADITIGDVLGSNIANILLILGGSAMVSPLIFKKNTMILEIPFALATAIVLALLLNGRGADTFHGLTRQDGLVLLTLFALFLFYVFRFQKTEAVDDPGSQASSRPLVRSVGMVVAGIPALLFGAKWVVEGATAVAAKLGVPEAVIGLTIVAVGTSLPELATSLTAAFKRQPDIAVGNVIGSNIFNICWILGVSSFVSPLAIPQKYFFDVGVTIAATLILLCLVAFGRPGIIGRRSGAVLVIFYAAYLVSLIHRSFGADAVY